MNPNTPETPTPIETTPAEPNPVVPFPAAAPVSPVVPAPKKSRKKLLIGLIITAVVLIAGTAAAFLIVNSLTSQAKDAASSYRTALNTHLAAVLDVKSIKERLDLYPKKPALETVTQGEALSKEYKDAVALQARYNKMLDDSYSTVAERYSTLELNPWVKDLIAVLGSNISNTAVTVTDEASLANAKEQVKGMETKATSLAKLSERLKSYTFAEKYREYQTNSANALEGMAKTWTELAELATTSNNLSAKLLEVQKSGDSEAAEKLSDEVKAATTNTTFQVPTIAREYQQYASTVSKNNKLLFETISADKYGVEVYNRSSDSVDALTAFQKELKK